eukprot:TRINITY_DN73754_c0_g1_i1.p1 TRINITY_DN73754_c0_g1~~TRINITY_DN73754_c0_g1_i1.p1  ORF type:complete len:648 (+),score=108.35 TRINITY_DN73754_c0_g1_i1:114-1946(+)
MAKPELHRLSTFSMNAYQSMASEDQDKSSKLTCFSTEIEFSVIQLRQVFRKLEKIEHSKKVHVSMVRRCIRNLLDLYSFHLKLDVEMIGSQDNTDMMTWQDFRTSIDRGVMPVVKLSFPQIVYVTLEQQSSIFGMFWYVLTNFTIILNIALLVAVSMPEVEVLEYFYLLTHMEHWCVYFFVLDYMLKAVFVCWCPIAMIDDRWLLQEVNARATSKVQHSKFERFWFFATTPGNVVDLASITPLFLAYIVEGTKLPLSSLRMLRLLRIFRVLKSFRALGKWVVELQVLGEAFYNSLGTVAVLLIYMALLAMLAGAIINNQDRDSSEVFETVPWSMWYVVARFVGMQGALPNAAGVVLAPLSCFVLASVGLFKGIIFLLPIDRLKEATKHAEEYYKELSELTAEIEAEDLRKKLPPSVAWTVDTTCPVVRIEIFEYSESLGGPTGEARGLVKCPVPILRSTPEADALRVPVIGPSMRRFCGAAPHMEIGIKWEPSEQNRGAPKGKLLLTVVQGISIRNSGERWCCRFEVPSSLYGESAGEQWLCGPCDAPSTNPTWSVANSKEFSIEWEAAAPEEPHESKEAKFQEQVCAMLTSHAEQIQRLEEALERLSAK